MTTDYVLWMKRTERSIEQRMGRFCGVEFRKGLPQEPTELIKVIVNRMDSPVDLELAGLYALSFLSIIDRVTIFLLSLRGSWLRKEP